MDKYENYLDENYMSNSNKNVKKKNKVFKDFSEYWHFIKFLDEEQRKKIISCLSFSEQKFLKSSYDDGGWEDFFIRNSCDHLLEKIKNEYSIDLLEIRFKILSNNSQLIQKKFWYYVTLCFDRYSEDHTNYIFGNIKVENFDEDYVKLTKKA